MNHSPEAGHRLRRKFTHRVPRNLSGTPRRTPHQPHHLGARLPERRHNRGPNRPRSSANQHTVHSSPPVRTLPVHSFSRHPRRPGGETTFA
jgi:hypothetical protein